MKVIRSSPLFFLAFLTACSSAELNRSLDEKVARESAIHSQADLDAKATRLMANAPGLTESQRERLAKLKSDLRVRLKQLGGESLKLRSLLVEDILGPPDKAAEIEAVKARLRGNAKARIEAIFASIDEANDVVGRSTLMHEAMDLQMMDDFTRIP